MKKRKKKLWSYSAGRHGFKVRAFQDPTSGILYRECRGISRSLRHRDKERAKREVQEDSRRLEEGIADLADPTPTLSCVAALYLQHQSPLKGLAEQKADKRRAEMWARWLGPKKDLSLLSLREWQGFVQARGAGAIDARGEPVPMDDRQLVRPATVAADLTFLVTLLNWAVKWRTDAGPYLMRENPARGYAMPADKNQRRPVADEARFQGVRAVADKVMMVVGRGKNHRLEPSYLPALLPLAWHTGRRFSAILHLKYDDLKLTVGPCGSIRWPSQTDKRRKEWVAPLNSEARKVIDEIMATRPGIGAAYLFPNPNDPSKPIRIETASRWLVEAESLAGLEKQDGSLWHAYRRGWATSRKWMPAQDVAAAGGWSDLTTLTEIYMQADQQTMFEVVSHAPMLKEGAASN